MSHAALVFPNQIEPEGQAKRKRCVLEVLVCQHITENAVAGVPRLSLLAVELKMKWIDAVEVKLLSLDADTNGTGDLNYLSVSLL